MFVDPNGENAGIIIIVVITFYGAYKIVRFIYRGGKLHGRANENRKDKNDLHDRMLDGEDISQDEINEVYDETKELLDDTQGLAEDMLKDRMTTDPTGM